MQSNKHINLTAAGGGCRLRARRWTERSAMGTVARLPLVLLVAFIAAVLLAGCGGEGKDRLAWLRPVSTPSARSGASIWVVGVPDVVLGSTDGGASWRVAYRGEITDDSLGDLWSVAFGDAAHGWAVRRGHSDSPTAILATSDSGATWVWQHPAAQGRLLAVAAIGASHVWAGGYTGARALLLATDDGGTTWSEQRVPGHLGLYAIAFSDVRHGWALGAGPPDNLGGSVVLATVDGGAHWRVVYRAAEAEHLRGLSCSGPRRCWVVGWTDAAGNKTQGRILMTQDGGRRWMARGLPPAEALVDVAFPDARHGWAVGSAGTILATSDGGGTWVPQRVDERFDLRAVAFSDAKHGWALIKSLALLVTTDGGKTWSVVLPSQSGWYLTDVTCFGPRGGA